MSRGPKVVVSLEELKTAMQTGVAAYLATHKKPRLFGYGAKGIVRAKAARDLLADMGELNARDLLRLAQAVFGSSSKGLAKKIGEAMIQGGYKISTGLNTRTANTLCSSVFSVVKVSTYPNPNPKEIKPVTVVESTPALTACLAADADTAGSLFSLTSSSQAGSVSDIILHKLAAAFVKLAVNNDLGLDTELKYAAFNVEVVALRAQLEGAAVTKAAAPTQIKMTGMGAGK